MVTFSDGSTVTYTYAADGTKLKTVHKMCIRDRTFTLAGNLLNRVDDAAAASAYGGGFEFKDGVKQANEYNYDSNGNLRCV